MLNKTSQSSPSCHSMNYFVEWLKLKSTNTRVTNAVHQYTRLRSDSQRKIVEISLNYGNVPKEIKQNNMVNGNAKRICGETLILGSRMQLRNVGDRKHRGKMKSRVGVRDWDQNTSMSLMCRHHTYHSATLQRRTTIGAPQFCRSQGDHTIHVLD